MQTKTTNRNNAMTIKELIANHEEQRFQYASAVFNGDTLQAAFHLAECKRLRKEFSVLSQRGSLVSRLNEPLSGYSEQTTLRTFDKILDAAEQS